MKLKNIIDESLDLTTLQGQLLTLKKNYEEMGKSVQANPMLAKEYAPQMNNMSAGITALEKQLAALGVQQKQDNMLAAKQAQLNKQNATKPGTTQSLSQQAVKPAAPAPTAPATPNPAVKTAPIAQQ